MSACAGSRSAKSQRFFVDSVDALRIEARGADLPPFVDATKHRTGVDVREIRARRVEPRPAGRRQARSRRRRRKREVLVRRRRDGQDRKRRPVGRRRIGGNKLALFEVVNAKSSDFGTPATAGAEGEQQKGAIAQVDRPAPRAGGKQPVENVASDRLRALACTRAIGGADGKTQRVSN